MVEADALGISLGDVEIVTELVMVEVELALPQCVRLEVKEIVPD